MYVMFVLGLCIGWGGGGTVYMRSRGDVIGVASRPIKTTRLTLNERTGDVYLYIRYSQKEWDIEKKRAERRKKCSINQIAIAAGSCHRFVCGNVIMFVWQSGSRVHLLCEACAYPAVRASHLARHLHDATVTATATATAPPPPPIHRQMNVYAYVSPALTSV